MGASLLMPIDAKAEIHARWGGQAGLGGDVAFPTSATHSIWDC